jgi:hypothetical protein
LAIWWLCSIEHGASAKELQRFLGLPSYQTAWTWLQKLRLAIACSDQQPCQGVVEIGSSTVNPAWEKNIQAIVLTAAELILPIGITGRIRMSVISSCTFDVLQQFLKSHVEDTVSLLAPGFSPFDRLSGTRYSYVIDSKLNIPKRVEEVNRSFEIWLNTIHRGGVGLKHLQLYLDEFCFHNNASLMADRLAVFHTLVNGVLQTTPKSYKEIVETSGGNEE